MLAYNLNGWIPDHPDHRDEDYCAHKLLKLTRESSAPAVIDLSPKMGDVLDQGDEGSCVSNGIAKLVQYVLFEEGQQRVVPARNFIYYNGRMLQGTQGQDSGLSIRIGMKAGAMFGWVPETEYPYNTSSFTDQPEPAIYRDAFPHRFDAIQASYAPVQQNLQSIKQVLASDHPVVFGFTVYQSFMKTGKNGIVAMPTKSESVKGGHCMLIVGANDNTGYYKVLNSWSNTWGDQGYCYMRYDYLGNMNLASDFWTLVKAA